MALRLGRWLVVLAVMLSAEPAGAYCRTRTCEFRRTMPCALEPGTGCSLDGPFVFWPDSCIPFAVQRDGSALDGLSASMLEALIEDAFRVWSEVPCPRGGTPEIGAASQGPIACDQVEYDCTERETNSNLMVFRDDFIDADPGLHFGVIALTTLTANLRTGELFDADMEINTRDEDFVLDGGGGIAEGEPRNLRGVVYHELGHLLGLSHSWENGALMREAYEGTLEPGEDDIEGICAALGASENDPTCFTAPLGADAGCVGHDVSCTTQRRLIDQRSCACELAGAAPGGSPRWLGLGWTVAALLFGQLRRSRRCRSVL